MKRLIWILTIFVAATFLLINTPNLSSTQAYGCSNNSTNTNHTAGVNGTSGNVTKSAASSGHSIGDQNKDIACSIPRSRTISAIKPCGVGGGGCGGYYGGGGGTAGTGGGITGGGGSAGGGAFAGSS